MLDVRNLRKVYGDHVAVEDISLNLDAGGSLAVVGESGSGKTTTARIIAGLEQPSAGTVTMDGVPGRMGQGIQMVFQDPYSSLDRRQTIGSAIAEAIRLRQPLRGTALDARVVELLTMVGLDEQHARALPRNLSGGQRQRVAIARALAVQPRLLILDEAVAALDVSIQAQVLNLLAKIRADTGVALLFITHDLAAVRHLSAEVLVMKTGCVVERGSVDDVLGAPQHPYTRRLIDSIPKQGWKPRRRKDLHEPR